jgi:enoyl-CoA hydratase/carnithine racemase
MARRRRPLSASHRITAPASIATTRAMQLLNEFPKPTIALVHGACFGGGVGLVCCVDVAFTTRITVGITETRVGVAPAPISTHMVNAIGLRHTRRYALIGERFDVAEAERNGLSHEVVPADAMGRPRSRRPKAASSRPTTCCWMSARLPCWRTRVGRRAPRRRGSKAPPPSGRSANRPGTSLFTPTCS